MSEQRAHQPRFTVGSVLSASVMVAMRNIATFGAITAIIGIPYILIFVFVFSRIPRLSPGQRYTAPLSSGMGIGIALFVIVGGLTYVVVQAAINYGTFSDLRRQKAGIGECLQRGLVALPTLIGAYLLVALGFAVIFGIVVLLSMVTGIIGVVFFIAGVILVFVLFMMWWVLIPSIVVERTGVIASFARSRDLTAGHRWRIFGLILIVSIAQGFVNWVVTMVAGLFGVILSLLASVLVTLFFIAFAGILTAVGYYYLRAEKEGIAIDDIASVFD